MNTKYYKINDAEFDMYPTYIELDDDYYCLRQITQVNDTFINTSIAVEGDFFLPEGSFNDCLEFLTDEISKQTFEELWEASKKPYLSEWKALKQEFQIGQQVNGQIVCFYPQGIILDIGKKFYAIANYDTCKVFFGTKKLYPKQVLSLQIANFDNLNMWIQLNCNAQ